MCGSKSTIRWISDVTGRKKLYMVILLILQALIAVIGVVYALVLRSMIDGAAAKNMNTFVKWLIVFITLIILRLVLGVCGRYLEMYTCATIENCFKRRLFSTLLYKEYASVSAVHSGEWVNRLTNDAVVVADGVTQILPGLIGLIVKLVGALAAIIFLAPMFGWIIIPGGIVVLLLSYTFRPILKRLHKRIQEKDGALRVFLQEHLESLVIVKSFNVADNVLSEADESLYEHKKARIKRAHFSNICTLGFAAVMNGAYVAGAVVCCLGIIAGTITYGTLMAVLQLIAQIQSPFAGITGYLSRYYAMLASAERIMEAEMLQADDFMNNERAADKDINEFYNGQFESIQLKNVSFSYGNGAGDVLSDFSETIKKGDYIAITGTTGCGKSTIFRLLMGLYHINGGSINVKTVSEGAIDITNVRDLFAYVPQGNLLMSGTIRDIVSFADKSDSDNDERIKEALRISLADEFVNELENGADTLLGERGLGLSEGQMQRLAIARAIFSKKPILLFDESTSALDEVTEQMLLDNLKNMTDKTVLIVTHRRSVLDICDKEISL